MFRKLMMSVAGLATVACMVLPGMANAEGFRGRVDRDDFHRVRVAREYRPYRREPIRRFVHCDRCDPYRCW